MRDNQSAMFSWLRRVLSKSNERETRGVSPTIGASSAPVQLPKFTITVSVADRKRAAKFRSAAVSVLWDEVGGISHPDHPFLDRSYSPSTQMPAADFTPWVVDRLATNDWSSIAELLSFITYEHQVTALERTFQSYDFSRFIQADQALLLELQAVAILAYRILWTGHADGRLSLIEDIFQHCLASYPFAIRPSEIEHLLAGANKLIRKRNRELKEMRAPEPLLTVNDFSQASDVSAVGEALRTYPPTFRACITLSMQWGLHGPGMIEPRAQGEYGLRQFGLSAEQNLHFFRSCGLFGPMSNINAVAERLTKDDLVEIANAGSVAVAKSWKKERIVSALLNDEGTRAAIKAKTTGDLVQIRDDILAPFNSWRARVTAMQPAARCLANA